MTAQAEIAFDTDRDYEVVDGKMEEKMAGARHGRVCARLIVRLGAHVETNGLGGIYTPDTTFQIGSNERLPDVSFVSSARIPEEGDPIGKWEIAPDLAVEIISPSDSWDKVNRKVAAYFAAGVREVWLVSLDQRTISIYTSPTQARILKEDDELTSEELLPGFHCRVSELFGQPVNEDAEAKLQ
jgi:Uma2 family endonuclease